jgi:DNA-binding NarL/FixJ family response regulator
LTPREPLRVVVASKSPRAAHRLEALLTSHESVKVPGKVDSASDLLKSAEQQPFDVVVSDLDLTNFEPIQVARVVSVNGREVRRIKIAGFQAVQIGVAEFQKKPFSRDEFLAVVRAALID